MYSHQCHAIDRIRNQEDVLVATPTASGKGLIYNLPVLNDFCKGEKGHAMYLFPLKALAQDQRKGLEAIWQELQLGQGGTCQHQEFSAIYDGDTKSYQRRKI